jgi:hypothetical protein
LAKVLIDSHRWLGIAVGVTPAGVGVSSVTSIEPVCPSPAVDA